MWFGGGGGGGWNAFREGGNPHACSVVQGRAAVFIHSMPVEAPSRQQQPGRMMMVRHGCRHGDYLLGGSGKERWGRGGW